jgi:hypothetical protein
MSNNANLNLKAAELLDRAANLLAGHKHQTIYITRIREIQEALENKAFRQNKIKDI